MTLVPKMNAPGFGRLKVIRFSYMSEGREKNLRIISQSMGSVFIQPLLARQEDIEDSRLVICPHRIPEEQLPVVEEWAAGSQTPIFCHERDIRKFEEQGFGTYRFHGLSGYKEIGFQGGVVEFYPGRRRKLGGLRGLIQEAGELFGLLKAPAYHVLMRPRGEKPLLFLSSSNVDSVEWNVLNRSRPSVCIGSPEIPDEDWDAFSRRYGVTVLRALDCGEVRTEPVTRGDSGKDASQTWPEKVSSLS